MPTPVTFIIPCYNHGAFVADAARSALAQLDADARVVIIDDGSDDATTAAACDACAGERVRVVHQSRAGLPAARNRGAALADTPFLVFLDADDWVEPAFVKSLADALSVLPCGMAVALDSHESPPEHGCAEPQPCHPTTTFSSSTKASGTGVPPVPTPPPRPPASVSSDALSQPPCGTPSHAYCQERLVGKGHGTWQVPDWDPLLMLITNLHPVTALVRADCFHAVGGFDESLRDGYEDWDLWLKFVERGWVGVRVREPLFVWRRHSDTTMVMQSRRSHESLYRALIDRHRALFDRHAGELIVRMNDLLRRVDAQWLDETLEPMEWRYLREAHRRHVNMPAVRLENRIRRALARLPRPIGGPIRGVLRLSARLLLGKHP